MSACASPTRWPRRTPPECCTGTSSGQPRTVGDGEALTPAYAPEAFLLTDPTPAEDVYSLSATIYALALGPPPHLPEEGSLSIAQLLTRHGLPLPDLSGAPLR